MAQATSDLTLFYDADCGFCSWAAARAVRLAPPGRIVAVPIRSAAGDIALGDLAAAERDGSWHLAAADGRRWSAGAAVAPLLRELPALSRLAPLAEAFPGLVDSAYRFVARRRGRLSRLLGGARCGGPGGRRSGPGGPPGGPPV